MSTKTTNLELIKPDVSEYYDIAVHNQNMDTIDKEITDVQNEVTEVKKSVSDGKMLVAGAITEKGIETATDATFATMAENIRNIQSGTDTSEATATPSDILVGKTAGVGGEIIAGSMPDNGAITQLLGINDTYVIPAGYHNGEGTVSQNILTKEAEVFTPNDNIQLINAGQYLNGAQTISAVPTETKTVTAGVSAVTVSRTAGKYLTDVTVNPTPSQSKTVIMTSSPLTISPDSGYLLSEVTVSASLGKKYASGTSGVVSTTLGGTGYVYLNWVGTVTNTSITSTYTFSLNVSFSPSIIRFTFLYNTFTYRVVITPNDYQLLVLRVYEGNSEWGTAYTIVGSGAIKIYDATNKVVRLAGLEKYITASSVITWEAWE